MRLIPLAVNNLLVVRWNVHAVLHHIHALICVMAHSKDTSEHLQEAEVGAGGGGGTTTAGSVRRSYIQRRRGVAVDWSLRNIRVKSVMCHILVEPFVSHRLDHAHDIGSKSTRSERVDGYVLNFIHNVVKDIKVLILHEGVKEVPIKGWCGV
jgi:hypothetical protein